MIESQDPAARSGVSRDCWPGPIFFHCSGFLGNHWLPRKLRQGPEAAQGCPVRKSSLFSSLSPQRPPAMASTIPPTPRAMSPSVGPPMTQICPTGCKKKENRAWERGSGRDCHRGFSLLVSHALSSSRSLLVSPGHAPPLSPCWTLSGLHLVLNLVQETHRVRSTMGLSALSSAGRPTGHGPCHHSWVTRPSMNILWFPHPALLVSGSLQLPSA